MTKKSLILLIIILACVNIIGQQQGYRWRVALKPMPHPVWGGQVIYDQKTGSKKIYILGGHSDSSSIQNSVDWIQEYDVANDSWRIVGHMKQPRQLFVADIWDSSVVYFGGVDDTSSYKNDLEAWKFKPSFGSTRSIGSDVNFGRSYSTGQVIGDSLYIIGGNPIGAGTTLPYIAEYNLNKNNFGFKYYLTSGDIPEQHMTMIVNDNIYIFGGVFNGVENSIRKFNIPTKSLELFNNQKLPSVRANGAAVYNSITHRGYLIGGYQEPHDVLSTVEEVTFQADGTLKFTPKFPSLNFERENLMAVSYGAYVVVLGGKDKEGKVVPWVEILEPDTSMTSSVDVSLPQGFKLMQNYPNPFNPSTTISYQIPYDGFVTLKVYDVLGREVATLVNEVKNPGNYNVEFNVSQISLGQASGIYYYRLTVNDAAFGKRNNFSETKKMVYLK